MDDPLSPIVIIVLSLLLAAVVRLADAAVPFLDDAELRRRADEGSPRAKRAVWLIERAEKPFGEIRVAWLCLLLIGFSFAWSRFHFAAVGAFASIGEGLNGVAGIGGLLLILLPYTLASIVVAGIIPTRLAAHGRQKLFDHVAPVAQWTVAAFTPIALLGRVVSRLLLMPFGLKPADSSELVTEEDILEMVDIGEEKGAIEADEKEMIENIFEFNNMDAGDCMIHRKDIIAIDIEATHDEIMNTIRESGRSRFPVYEDSIDNVLGILFTRDFLLDQCEGRHSPLKKLIRPAHFVPESVRTDVLFKEMQSRKQHIAIVVDEYGGTSGLITLEDLLEEIVGNIYDEFDPKEDEDIQPLGAGKWRVSGAAELENVAEALEIDLPTEEEFDTLGGLIFSRLTEIPADGQHPVVECFGLRISVERIADRRVEWAIVEKLPESQAKKDE